MPKVQKTSKVKVPKGTKVPFSTSAKGNNAEVKQIVKAKVHKK